MKNVTWIADRITGRYDMRDNATGVVVATVYKTAERGWRGEWDGGSYIGSYGTIGEAKREIAAEFARLDGCGCYVHPDDGGRVEVYRFDARDCLLWSAKFDGGVPDAAVIATVAAA